MSTEFRLVKCHRMKLIAQNRKARHAYHVLDTIEAGLDLQGTEVKSLRQGEASIAEAYVVVEGNEAYVIGMTIPEYSSRGYASHGPGRRRKLLLHKREIGRLAGTIAQKGLTAIPLKLYFADRGWAKMEVAFCRGKSAVDKRQDIRKRSDAREMDRARKRVRRKGRAK